MPDLREVQIELSGTCNVNCSYCTWRSRESGAKLMDKGLALRLLDEAANLSPRPLVSLHSVGESTLHPDFPVVVGHAEDLDLETRLSTNCTRLEGRLARILRSSVRLEMILALHGGIPERTFEHAVNNAVDYLASRPANRRVEVLSVCAVTNPLKPSWFCSTFLDLVERLPQAFLHFKQPCTFPQDKKAIAGFIPALPEHARIAVERTPTPRSLGRGCTMPNYLLVIQADGTPAPCCVGQEDWGLPNAHGTSLQGVWQSARLDEIRKLWQEADDSLLCGHCLKRTDC